MFHLGRVRTESHLQSSTAEAHTPPRESDKAKSTWALLLKEPLFPSRTSEGVHVSLVVRGDGVQVNAAAALSLHMVALIT